MSQPQASQRPPEPPFMEWAWNHKLLMLPIVAVLALSICSGFLGLVYISAVRAMRSDPLHTLAMQHISQNETIKEELGEPIRGGFITAGNVQVDDENQFGTAEGVEIPIAGPKSDGKMVINARMTEGTWAIESLTALLKSGRTVHIDPISEIAAPQKNDSPEPTTDQSAEQNQSDNSEEKPPAATPEVSPSPE